MTVLYFKFKLKKKKIVFSFCPPLMFYRKWVNELDVEYKWVTFTAKGYMRCGVGTTLVMLI